MTRDHILSEIRRVAGQNGEKAVGWRRFEAETGIGIADWMRYWARWGEAVREAGFSPLEFNAGFDDAVLLECYAKLVRETGRIPAWSDLRLKANTDSSFPSEKVFRRFKTKGETIRRLLEYCREAGGWDDVISVCSAYVPTKSRALSATRAPDEAEGVLFIY